MIDGPGPTLFGEYAAPLLAERDELAGSRDLRRRARFDALPRPAYAFGLLAAADVARFSGIDHVVAIEFGVAEGHGLRAMAELAAEVTLATGVRFTVVGFDTGSGLPPLDDYRDHPEIWQAGDFPSVDRAEIEKHGRMFWGDIAQTLPEALSVIDARHPVGFVSIDVDIYRSTVDSLRLFDIPPDHLLPVVPCYFDDTLGSPLRIGSLMRNRWCGQLLSIDEFNESRTSRKFDEIRTLRHRRPFNQEPWLQQVYGLHVLDHALRQPGATRPALTIAGHSQTDRMEWPL